MRIIDNNKDFYDYYQDIYPDDTFTFDRRDSYVLTKEEFASSFIKDLRRGKYMTQDSGRRFILLQICNTYWLFVLTILTTVDTGVCTDYDLKLITTWKNYDKKRELLKLSNIKFNHIFFFEYKKLDIFDSKMIKFFIDAINTNDIKELKVFNKFKLYRDNIIEERHIPILKNIGIASEVNPQEIYLALDEYFSAEKTASERTDAVGTTNNDKIESHGFDLKTSFRGKNR